MCRVRRPNLEVNQILDLLEEEEIADVDEVFLEPPEGTTVTDTMTPTLRRASLSRSAGQFCRLMLLK